MDQNLSGGFFMFLQLQKGLLAMTLAIALIVPLASNASDKAVVNERNTRVRVLIPEGLVGILFYVVFIFQNQEEGKALYASENINGMV
jgi:hypothetical protein